jgi:hypothetical protein
LPAVAKGLTANQAYANDLSYVPDLFLIIGECWCKATFRVKSVLCIFNTQYALTLNRIALSLLLAHLLLGQDICGKLATGPNKPFCFYFCFLRELAMQLADQFRAFGAGMNLKVSVNSRRWVHDASRMHPQK